MAHANQFPNFTARKATRQQFRAALQTYATIIIAPPADLPAGQLEAQRIHAAIVAISAAMSMPARADYNRMAIAHDVAEMTKSAPRGKPTLFDRMQAERIMIDLLHTARAAAKAGK